MNLRTNDVAAYAGTSVFTIREYSDMGLLGPVNRSGSANRRQFDPRVIPVACLWLKMRGLGLSLQDMQTLGEKRTPEGSRNLFREYSQKLSAEIANLQSSLDMLLSFSRIIEEGQAAMPDKIEVRMLPELRIQLSSLENVKKRNEISQQRQAFDQLRKAGNISCPIGFFYRDFFDLINCQDRPAKFVSYDPQGTDIRPAGEYLIGTEACCYEENSTLPQRMQAYARQNSLEFLGPIYTISLLDAASVTSKDQFLYQVAVQVRRM